MCEFGFYCIVSIHLTWSHDLQDAQFLQNILQPVVTILKQQYFLRFSRYIHFRMSKNGRYLLTVSRKRNQNEIAWKNTKKLATHLILGLMCFLFFQANLILVPFPTHRKQVPSWYLIHLRILDCTVVNLEHLSISNSIHYILDLLTSFRCPLRLKLLLGGGS